MADLEATRTRPIEQFFEVTKNVPAGMLGIEGSGHHMQPMHANCDPEAGKLWFFAKSDSDIAADIGEGRMAHFCVIGPSQDYYACVSGPVTLNSSQAAIDRYWNSVAAAWFHDKSDPKLIMIEMTLHDGMAWASTDSSLAFGWEILKSNMTGGEPDVGVRQSFTF